MADGVSFEDRIERLVRSPVFLLFAGGVALCVFSGWLWWSQVHTSPRAVFRGMLADNLRLTAVTDRQVSREIDGLRVDKTSRLLFGRQHAVDIRAVTAASDGTRIATETIATSDQEFNRYTGIQARRSDGTAPDTAAVLGKWAGGRQTGTAFAGTVLRPYGLLLGYLPPADRAALVGRLIDEDVFATDYRVTRSTIEGRAAYTYDTRIRPAPYIAALKQYAGVLGLRDLEGVDPAEARQTAPVAARISVDPRTHRLLKAEYPGLGFTETFSGHNVGRDVTLPSPELSAARLRELVAGLR